MQRLSENMPRVVLSVLVTGRAIVTFRTPGGPGLAWGGAGAAIAGCDLTPPKDPLIHTLRHPRW